MYWLDWGRFDGEWQYNKAVESVQFPIWFRATALLKMVKHVYPSVFLLKCIPIILGQSIVHILWLFHHCCCYIISPLICMFFVSDLCLLGFCFRVFMQRNNKSWSQNIAGFTVTWMDICYGLCVSVLTLNLLKNEVKDFTNAVFLW